MEEVNTGDSHQNSSFKYPENNPPFKHCFPIVYALFSREPKQPMCHVYS